MNNEEFVKSFWPDADILDWRESNPDTQFPFSVHADFINSQIGLGYGSTPEDAWEAARKTVENKNKDKNKGKIHERK